MDSIVDPQDPTLSQAFEQLAADEATDIAPASPDSAPTAPTAPEPEKTPESPTPEPKPEEGAPATAKPAESAKEPSKFEKAVARQADTWKQINAEKDEVRAIRKQLESDREALKAQQKAFEESQAKASQPKYRPEDYEAHAAKLELQARELDDQGEDKFADYKREQAKQARDYAKELRDNPPKAPDTKAEEEKFKAAQKEWWGKAAQDFPKVIVKDSPESKAVAELIQQVPQIQTDPQMMYYAARLATAEVAAARVPTMEKELGAAHAKIKDLEGKLQVPTDGIAQITGESKSFEQKTEADQYAEVEALARELDNRGAYR